MPISLPLIVLTNDDGIRSPGLRALARALAPCGELLIVAPREQQTSMGRAIHGDGHYRPVVYFVGGRRLRAFDVPGSPAVAVRNAVMLVADRKPAVVISGINYGENIGTGVTASGTVGAALEAASLGIPAIATSVQTELKYHRTHTTRVDFSAAAALTCRIAQGVLDKGLPRGADVLNVNVPCEASPSLEWRWTRASRLAYFQSTVTETRAGRRFDGYEMLKSGDSAEPDSDIYALLHDHIASVSPLTIDLTARVTPRELDRWALPPGAEPEASRGRARIKRN